MKTLIAEDEEIQRIALDGMLRKWGHSTVLVDDGEAAWREISAGRGIDLVVVDWGMPGMDGPELCRRIRSSASARGLYVILLTARDGTHDLVAGLEAGADDFVRKPFDAAELRARIGVAARQITLQNELAQRIRELEDARAREHRLLDMIPICSYCRKVRDDRQFWGRVEDFVGSQLGGKFSHGVCPSCYEKILLPEMDAFRRAQRGESNERAAPPDPAPPPS